MRKDAQPPTGGIYRPRNPRASPLYQCVRRHSDELHAARLVHRPVEAEVLERFLDCGDLHKGFARVYCYQCGHDYLLHVPRRKQPRQHVEAGSVGIADGRTGLYALSGPGGWPLIGRTTFRLFDPQAEEPFPIRAGMRIKFVSISAAEAGL